MEAQGSLMTNKYAEGYPNKRYYGGCQHVDEVEELAVVRAKDLFNAEYANVQPHSGSQANMAVYFGLLNPGDTILGMNLSHGGHLTHGSPASFSWRFFKFVHYGVKEDNGFLDYNQVAEAAKKNAPKMIIAGSSAYPRILDFELFENIAKSVGALLMVDMAHIAGLVAADVHPSPIPYSDIVTTTTHKTLRGPRGGMILAKSDYGQKISKEVFPGIQGGPFMHVIAAKAVALKEAKSESFKAYQLQTVKNAKILSNKLISLDIKLVSDGTDNHMMLADLRNINITGKDAEIVLEKAGITVNKNSVPFETKGSFVTSGIRIGTPAVTSRGMKEPEMEIIAGLVADVLKNPHDSSIIVRTNAKVRELCEAFPLYPAIR